MSESADALRAAAAILLSKAAELDGGTVPSGFDPANWRTWWPAMLRQYENDGKPRAWVDWGPGVLPDQAGNNEREPPIYEGAKPFWQQMERNVPFVYDDHGQRFNGLACVRRGGWPDFERNVRRLWSGPDGDAWRAAPENADRVARIKV